MRSRAVIYARCSTEEECQKDALIKQVAEARECVEKQGWVLVDSYVESRSGTSTRGRTEYNRLYDDLLRDKFDIVVIKSQDRLMRNTKDWYLFVDRLTVSQKQLYMYIERKFYSTDDGLLTGIKAILAEEYSRELSKKINNAHYNRQKKGGSVMLPSNTYGFCKGPDKSVEIVEEEAKVIRRVFMLYTAGYGCRTIAGILAQEGVTRPTGKEFLAEDMRRMIRNPMYKGTVVMRRVHYDFDSKQTIKMPKEKQFIHENRVQAIVSEELWQRANDRMDEKRTVGIGGKKIGKNEGKSSLSGKLRCGICGAPYYRITRRKGKTKEITKLWSCREYLTHGRICPGRENSKKSGCDNIHLDEKTLYGLLKDIYIDAGQFDSQKIIKKSTKMLEDIFVEKDTWQEIERQKKKQEQIRRQMDALLDKLLDEIIPDVIYQMKQKELEQELQKNAGRIHDLEQKKVKGKEAKQRIAKIEKFLQEKKGIEKAAALEFLDQLETVFVYPDHLKFVFYTENNMPYIQDGSKELDKEENNIRVDIGNRFDYFGRKREEREKIVERMKENPHITAKQLAEELGISLSGINYKIRALKKEGRICFRGKGRNGIWEVL